MYRVQAIILYRQIIRDNQVRTVLFSHDFWKITVWEKWHQWWDIWSTVEALIERVSWQNQLKKIDIQRTPSLSGWSYEELAEYLYIFQILYITLPDWVEHLTLYKDLLYFLHTIDSLVWKVYLVTYMQARIMKNLWYLDSSYYWANPILAGFYKHILSWSMKSMLYENHIPKSEYNIIRSSILEARHTYTHRN